MQASSTSWKRKPFKEGIPLQYQTSFSTEQFDRLREGLIPRQMEDKWFIYYEEPHLFLHRGWTGLPVYRLTLLSKSDGAEVQEALWSKELADASPKEQGIEYQVQLLDFLLFALLLGESKPFPLPPNLQESKHGVFQHVVSGTGYPQSVPPRKKPWWRICDCHELVVLPTSAPE